MPGFLAARKIKVTYGTTAIGMGTNYVIDARERPISYRRDGRKFTFGCDVIVAEADEATFQASCASLEAAFSRSNKNKLLKLEFFSGPFPFGSVNTHEIFDPALTGSNSSTGFNHEPAIDKPGSSKDSALSRMYRVSVTLDLPATESGKNGRRDSSWTYLQTDSVQGLLVVEGFYTALGTKTAFENYKQNATTYDATIQTALTGTWEGPFNVQVKGDEEYGATPTNQIGRIVAYHHEYQEFIYPNAIGAQDVRLRRQVLIVDHGSSGPGDYAPGGTGVDRLHKLSVTYSTGVDKTATQDLSTVYLTVVKPFLVSEIRKAAGGRMICLSDHTPKYDRAKNRIDVSMGAMAVGNSAYVSSSIVTEDTLDPGVETVGKWTGKKLDKEVYDNPGSLFRTVVHAYEVAADPSQSGATTSFNASGFIPNPSADQNAAIDSFFGVSDDSLPPNVGGASEPSGLMPILRGASIRWTPIVHGIQGEPQFTTTLVVKTKRWEYVLPGSAPIPGQPDPAPKVITGVGGGDPPPDSGVLPFNPNVPQTGGPAPGFDASGKFVGTW